GSLLGNRRAAGEMGRRRMEAVIADLAEPIASRHQRPKQATKSEQTKARGLRHNRPTGEFARPGSGEAGHQSPGYSRRVHTRGKRELDRIADHHPERQRLTTDGSNGACRYKLNGAGRVEVSHTDCLQIEVEKTAPAQIERKGPAWIRHKDAG